MASAEQSEAQPVTKSLQRVDAVEGRTGLPKQTIYRLVREGVVPAVHAGRTVLFDMDRIEQWIAAGGAKQ